MTIASHDGMSGLFFQLDALSVRVEKARTGAEARAQAMETARPSSPSGPPAPPANVPGPGRRGPSRRRLVLALVLVLLGAGVAAIVAGGRGEGTRTPDSTSVDDGTVARDGPSPAVTGVPNAPSVSPVSPGPAPAVAPPSAIPAPQVAAVPLGESVTDAATSIAVEAGDSFWAIAEHRVASARGTTPTTVEVAGYWAQLVEANQGRLAHPGNPNLIYAGQTFLLP